MSLKQTIEEIVEKHLPDEEHFIVDIQLIENSSKPQLKILIDADKGVSIDACAFLSRQVGEEIEAKELLADAYVLEVSSPGVDYPLNSRRQYVKNIGRKLKVTLTDGKETEGELLQVDPSEIKLKVIKKEKGKKATEEEVVYPLEEIKKSIVLVSFK
ncbi:ribosome maturation factor RimP [Belliella sp. R4-6]|uniref:Ribosome maturation factor RimP n=2 Tax=Belliella TaxID=232244 RepID=A0ABS9ULK5_9BACT|nr:MULTISPECIES: ribosome maturation factor RimP [Belliella]MCH7397507.1 ribosome maturation factor RimP [Belliella calami]MCH7413347.1 ribosome maturation factor RimP [Belliella alkalica]